MTQFHTCVNMIIIAQYEKKKKILFLSQTDIAKNAEKTLGM